MCRALFSLLILMSFWGNVSKAALSTSSALKENNIHYTITLPHKENAHTLIVTASFTSNSDGITKIKLPNSWGGETELFKHIRLLNVSPSTAQVFQEPNSPYWKIISPKQTNLVVQYQVLGELKNTTSRSYYRPSITKSQIHLIGETFLLFPASSKPFNKIHFSFNGEEKDWKYFSSLGAIKPNKEFIWNVEGSDFRSILIKGFQKETYNTFKYGPLQVVMEKSLALANSNTALFASQVFDLQHKFLKTKKPKFYLISMQSSQRPCCHFAGVNLASAVTLFVSPHAKKSAAFKQLLAHELFHRWNGRLLTRAYPEEEIFWFSEGFTNYLSLKINLKEGLISLDEFTDHLNQSLIKYYSSSHRDLSNKAIAGQFWQQKGVSHLPYIKGELLAFIWDEILGKTDLISFYKEFFDWAKDKNLPASSQTIKTFLNSKNLTKLSDLIDIHILNGKTLYQYPNRLGNCLEKQYQSFATTSLNQLNAHWAMPSRYYPSQTTTLVSIPQYKVKTENSDCLKSF